MTTQPYQATEERKHLTTGGPGKEQGTNKLPPTRILQRSTRGQQETDMIKKDILPCVSRNIHELADTVISKRAVNCNIDTTYEEHLVEKLSNLSAKVFNEVGELVELSKEVKTIKESDAAAMFYKMRIIPLMNTLREAVDEMETLCSSEHWCYPSYGDLLFSVR